VDDFRLSSSLQRFPCSSAVAKVKMPSRNRRTDSV